MSDRNASYTKIASAIYLITGFFADQEPLKWRLRDLAGDLASQEVSNKAAVSRELMALFGLARGAGIVSDTNHDILATELAKIAESMANPFAYLLEPSPRPEAPATPAREYLQAPAEPARPSEGKPSVVKDTPSPSKAPSEDRSTLKEFGAVSVKKNGRQSTIIALLKRKKEVMIKDISPLIPGCSEKTIQRELAEMVEEGILRKIGDKRWTRYTLAQ